ncbi:MAG: 3-phosphoshikimate 1-carboxyvinyltransferase [Lachnospiraceae bacterium]|nr:3-phosphoshikimate 1-carboxyvinyltransferase [Lachnospiraceae bacterium]
MVGENYKVHKLDAPIDWVVEVPGSKSMTNRALLMAALADGTTTLKGVLFSDDSRNFLGSLKSLGFQVEIDEDAKIVTVAGLNGSIPVIEGEIYVGSAGTAARFLTAMLAMAEGTFVVNASQQMKKRPMKPLFDVLESMGAEIACLEEEGFLPVRIKGIGGRLPAHEMCHVKLDISKSTQFLSALMLISPMVKQGLHIEVTSERKDGAYIWITRKMMEQLGAKVDFDGVNYTMHGGIAYMPGCCQIEPDVSAACYFYAAAALTGGRAVVKYVTWKCMQGDLKFIKLLAQMGCSVSDTPGGIEVKGAADGRLKGITVDMKDFSDQTMTLAALAPFADGDVRIENIGHIRLQESDRIHAIVTELTRLGISCEEEPDAVTIHPGVPKAGIVQTYDDHRMAMAFALIGLRTEGIEIADPMCCRKTFETYFEVLDRLCVGASVSTLF